MQPFIKVFNWNIPLYGLLIGVGIILGLIVILIRSTKMGIKRDDCFYCSLYAIIGLIVGGKLLYLATIIQYFIKDLSLFTNKQVLEQIFSGGYVFYGGLFGVIIMIYIYTKQYKLEFLKMMDCLTLGIPLSYGIGRIGCFMAGCCYGKPAEHGVYFNNSLVAPHDIKLLPVQLIDSFVNIIFFLVLYFFIVKMKRKSGFIVGVYLTFYSISRFFIEFLRYDQDRGIILGISLAQWMSIIILPIGLFLIYTKKHTKTV